MLSALLAVTPWMALTTANAVEEQAAVTLVYTHSAPALAPPPIRLGDECFLPVSQAGKIGWQIELVEGKAVVRTHGRNIETFTRELNGKAHVPLRTVVSALGGISEWNGDKLSVYSKVRMINATANSIEIIGTLPAQRSILVLDNPRRVVLDAVGARLDPADPPTVNGEVRFSQFTDNTVRAVAQVSGPPTITQGASVAVNVSVRWSGATTTSLAPLRPSQNVSRGDTGRIALGEPALVKDTLEETILSIPMRGGAPGDLVANRDRAGVFWVHIPNATREAAGPSELAGEVVKSATVTDRAGGGVSLRLELKRPMGVRVASSGSELLVTITLPQSAAGKLSEKIIVVDAGHGGSDSGARFVMEGKAYLEKDFTLQIARLVAEELNRQGATVLMTREGDSYPDLHGRPVLANNNSADFFISIHINSNATVNSSSGPFVYYHKDDVDSKLLADCIQTELAKATGLRDNGIRSDRTVAPVNGFAVLRGSNMPAALVEVAYINNTKDLRLLITPEFRQKAAQAIVRGIKVYIGDE